MNPLNKTPFLYLLIALVAGILLQYYGLNIIWSIIVFLFGGAVILFSFLPKINRQFSYRWLFGLGTLFIFLSIGSFTTYVKQEKLNYVLPDSTSTYVGYVTNTPQEKPRSIACKVYLIQEDINVVCYLQKDSVKSYPNVGDEIIFKGELQAFKNRGNPDDFDYERYMYNQGFLASVYLPSSYWIQTGRVEQSFSVLALQLRQKIMDLYTVLGFTDDEKAILSALTLGYQDTLSDDLKQSFRATGTVHVLSVSGLHVGIIYGVIIFLLGFVKRTSRYHWIKPMLVILLLWLYAFVTGLPPSVIRASTMLTVFCIGEIFDRKGNSLNNLFIAAFLMLLYNPFQLFDIGFQLSCLSVLSILVLHPLLITWWKPQNRFIFTLWSLLAISLSAQLATFPLCMYYFGTFPTYFFLTNLLIVPLVSLITYGVIGILALWKLLTLISLSTTVLLPLAKIVKGLVGVMVNSIRFFENLPHALVQNIDVPFFALVLIYTATICLLIAWARQNSKFLIISLSVVLLLLGYNGYKQWNKEKEHHLIVYNDNTKTRIEYKNRGQVQSLDSLLIVENNPVLQLDKKKVLIVNRTINKELISSHPYDVNYVIVTGSEYQRLHDLEKLYKIDTLILDGSLTSYVKRQLTKECENRSIPYYDVSKNGAYRINF